MSLSWPFKDPDEVLDYEIDWTARLAGDTISASTWIVPDGITKNSDTFTATSALVWLSAGVEGASLLLVNRVVTAGGRTMDQSVALKIKTK
jgi:hypothetical protein